jgi:anti-anti-sigma factor
MSTRLHDSARGAMQARGRALSSDAGEVNVLTDQPRARGTRAMKCIRTDSNGAVQLRVIGALDALVVHDIGVIFDAVVADRPSHVRIDFEELTVLDSSGVGAIVSLLKQIKAQGGEVVVVRAHDQPLSVLKLLKIEKLFGL